MQKHYSSLKIGIIGLGSIGVRHVEELVALGVQNVYALRTNKGAKVIPENLQEHVQFVYDTAEFLQLDLDGYIVANPTSLHMEALSLLKEKNKPVFVEKPLCSNASELQLLDGSMADLIQVGFCLRFLAIIRKVKALVDSREFGAVHHSRLAVGQYLPTWHPYTDYREEYFSQQKLGGGALRTLSHELDLALYFFGKPDTFSTRTAHTSPLEIDTDDYAQVMLTYSRHVCRIEMDFISKKTVRNGMICCESGDIHYDVLAQTIEVYGLDGKRMHEERIGPNNMYRDQMQAFLEFVQSGKKDTVAAGYNESVDLMNIIADEKPI